jgi:LL-diaminopimelate aminotransferase
MRAPAQRLRALPPYVFLELQRRRDEARAAGHDVIDLTVGNPDAPVPDVVPRALTEALRTTGVHGYPPFRGSERLRRSVVDWYHRRFGVDLDPTREVLPVLGSKEGLYHLMQAYLDPGSSVLVPTPCYPAYLGAARLCDAEPIEIPLRAENDFVLDLRDVPTDAARAASMLVVNSPHNPTGAVTDRARWREIVAFARDHDLLLVSDIPYSELVLDDTPPPPSVLEFPGAREIAVELQSLSKSHSMAGWRVGFAVGNAEAIGNLAKLKSNADFGMFLAVQQAAAAALDASEDTVAITRQVYRERREAVCDGLDAIGWPARRPRAGMYVWTRLPASAGDDDQGFVRGLFERTHVLLSPGSGFGDAGRGWVRLSLVGDVPLLRRAVQRIGDSGLVG